MTRAELDAAAPPVREKIAERCHAAYEKVIDPLRAVARRFGYALALHGSLSRDIDLIACPWVESAAEAAVLAEALRAEAERVLGWARMNQVEHFDEYHQMGCPEMKAHGRLVWSFHLGGGPYIDLSVMPRRKRELRIDPW